MLSGSRVEDIHDRIVRAVRDFFAQAGMSRAVLGLSGGIDSAVVASLAAEALGKDHVTGILMPSSWSTVHSVNDAVELADNLGIKYHIIPIGAVYDRFIKETEPLFEGDFHWDTTQENLQARIRGTILMLYSNRHGALLLNTTNKSELSMGYGTLYGDLCGSLMVIAARPLRPSCGTDRRTPIPCRPTMCWTRCSTASTKAAGARNRFCRRVWTRPWWKGSCGLERQPRSRSINWPLR